MNDRIVLLRLTATSMPDKPGEDWHRRVLAMVEGLAGAEEVGGSLTDLTWTLGPYDAIVRVAMPSDPAAAAFSLTLARKLGAQTTTLTALTDSDMDTAIRFTHKMNGPGPS